MIACVDRRDTPASRRRLSALLLAMLAGCGGRKTPSPPGVDPSDAAAEPPPEVTECVQDVGAVRIVRGYHLPDFHSPGVRDDGTLLAANESQVINVEIDGTATNVLYPSVALPGYVFDRVAPRGNAFVLRP